MINITIKCDNCERDISGHYPCAMPTVWNLKRSGTHLSTEKISWEFCDKKCLTEWIKQDKD